MSDIPGVAFRHRGLYLEDEQTVVIADLHLGRGFSAGVEVPLESTGDLEERLSALVAEYDPERVVFAGDILDAFDTIPPGVSARLDRLLDCVDDADAEPILLDGNHDAMLPAMIDRTVRETYRNGKTIIAHGHDELPETAERVVVGHQHPAIRIEGVKRPCYLVGPGQSGAQIIVLPAFTASVRGTVMNRRGSDIDPSIVSSTGINRFRPVVRDESAGETLVFPPFSRLRSFL